MFASSASIDKNEGWQSMLTLQYLKVFHFLDDFEVSKFLFSITSIKKCPEIQIHLTKIGDKTLEVSIISDKKFDKKVEKIIKIIDTTYNVKNEQE